MDTNINAGIDRYERRDGVLHINSTMAYGQTFACPQKYVKMSVCVLLYV